MNQPLVLWRGPEPDVIDLTEEDDVFVVHARASRVRRYDDEEEDMGR